MSEFLFIAEDKWLSFAEKLTGGEVIICGDNSAMYYETECSGLNLAHALCKLCTEICDTVHQPLLMNEFISKQIGEQNERKDS